MKSSRDWIEHFQDNLTLQRINWQQEARITPREKATILYGLKAWQKGETSDGSHLRKAAARFAEKHQDPAYLKAIELFIQEEQKHGANLGRYIDLIGEKRLQFDWGDFLFRKIRYFNTNMEVWTVTVIIVESAAQLFYQALKNATNCPLLREICTDILIDEAHHIRFQKERLIQILAQRNFLRFHLSLVAYFIFFRLTTFAIWFAHHKSFEAGGIKRSKFFGLMKHKILRAFDIRRQRKVMAEIKPLAVSS